MKRILISCLILCALGCKSSQQPSIAEEKPNVIIILADDLGYGDVSAYGGAVPTPHIDRLADKGILHTNAYAAASTCTPSRYSLLTGEYAWREKGRGVVDGDAFALIPARHQTVATIFKKAGYATAAIGKWHLGLGDRGGIDWNKPIPHTPNDIGFDESFIMPATSDRVPCVYLRNGRVLNLSPDDPLEVNYQHKIGNLPTGKENPELLRMRYSHGHYMTIVNGISRIGYQSGGVSALWKDEDIADDFVREARSFIGRHKDTPFFLYLATNNIHVPRMPHPRFQGKSAQGWRGDSILELDATVGAVMRTLDSLHLTEKTIVIFSSDNGPVLDDGYIDDAVAKTGAHNPFGGMRGGKYSTYQAGTRIPFIVSWKGKLHKQRSEALLSQVDFLGSISEALHVPYEAALARDTQPHWASWIGKDKKGRTYVVQEGLRNVLAVLKGKYKYIEPTSQTMKRAWETGIETGFEGAPQLYDLSVDPAEKCNIAGQQPAIVKEMEEILREEKSGIRGQRSESKE